MSKFIRVKLCMLILCIAFFACVGVCGKMDVRAEKPFCIVSSDDEFEYDENGALKRYTGNAEVLIIPEGVTAVRDWGLMAENEDNIKKIILPDSMETLGRGAFANYTNLEEVVMGNGLKTVDYQAFKNDNKVKLVYNKKMKNSVDYDLYSLQSVKTIELGENYSGDLNKAVQGLASPNLENVIVSKKNENYLYENGGIYSKNGEEYTLEGYIPSDETAYFEIKEGVTHIKSNAITNRQYKGRITAVFPSTLITADKHAVHGEIHGIYGGERFVNKINVDVSKSHKYKYADGHFSYLGDIKDYSIDGVVLSKIKNAPDLRGHHTTTEKGMIPVVITATTLEDEDIDITGTRLKVYDEDNNQINDAVIIKFDGEDCTKIFLPNVDNYSGKTIYVQYIDGMEYLTTTVAVELDEDANSDTVYINTRQNNKVTFSITEADYRKEVLLVDNDYHIVSRDYFDPNYSDLDYEIGLNPGEWKLILIDGNGVELTPKDNGSVKDAFDACGLVAGKDYLEYDINMEQENIDLGTIDIPDITSKLKYFTDNTGMTIKRDLDDDLIYYIVYFDYERTAARLFDPVTDDYAESLDFVLKVPEGYEPVIYHTTSTSFGPFAEWADNDRDERSSRIYHSQSDNNIYFTDKTIYNGSANYIDRIYMKVAATDVIDGELNLYWRYGGNEYLLSSVTLSKDLLAATVSKYSDENGTQIKGIGTPDSEVRIYKKKTDGGIEEFVGKTKTNTAGYFVYDEEFPVGTISGDSYIYYVEEYNPDGSIKNRVEAGKTIFRFDVPNIEEASCTALGNTYVIDPESARGPVVSYSPKGVVTFKIKLDDPNVERLFLKNNNDKYEFTKQEDGTWVFQGYNITYQNHMDLLAQITSDGETKEVFVADIAARWAIDPSGQAYEAVRDNYVEGAKATVYYKDPDTGKEVLWDAADYFQINPIITDKRGGYAWDVPVGKWKIRVEKDGYTPAESEWMTVPPIRKGVNLELKSVNEAEIKGIELGDDKITVTFDKYIYLDSLNVDAFTLTGIDGDVTISEVVPVEKAYRNQRLVTKRISLKVEGSLKDGEPEAGYTAIVKPGFTKTYADVVSTKESSYTGLKVTGVVDSISVPEAFMTLCGQCYRYCVEIDGSDSLKGRVITAEITDDSIAEVVGVTRIDENGRAYVVIRGKELGEAEIKISVDGSSAEITKDLYVLTDTSIIKKIATYHSIYNYIAIKEADFPEFFTDSEKEGDNTGEATPTPEATATPEATPTSEVTATPEATPTSEATTTPEATVTPETTATPEATVTPEATPSSTPAPEIGSTVKVGKVEYVIGKDDTVTYKRNTNKKAASVTIPASVNINGNTYTVTAIAANAFKNNKKLKKVTIGENVMTIGKSAFYGCKNLKTVNIKTSMLTSKTVGKKAFAKINAKAKVKVPKAKLKSYKKLLKSKGIKGRKQKITKLLLGK